MALLLKGAWRTILNGNKYKQPIIVTRRLCSSTELPSKSPDATMLALKSSLSTSQVLVTVQKHLHLMDHKHLMSALRTLFEMEKLDRSNEKLRREPAFNVLLENLKKHSRKLDLNECIDALKILSYLNVPIDSFIVQSLLQLIRCNINFLNIKQVMFLNFLLRRYTGHNHLVDVLNLALPLVFQIHLPLEIDQEDVTLLKEMLTYACFNNLPERCINNIVTGLMLNLDNIDVYTAKAIIWALCAGNHSLDMFPSRTKLLMHCFDLLSCNLNKLHYDDVLKTTSKLKGRIIAKHQEFYNARFMDAVAEYVLKSQLDFERGFLVARSLSRIAHTHLGLVKYLCHIAMDNPQTLVSAPPNILFGFVNCLANHDHEPDPAIIKQIALNPIMNVDNIQLPWAKFSLELASLGYFDDRLLKTVFSENFLTEYLNRSNNTLDYLQLLTLHEAVKALHDNVYTMPNNILKRAKELYPVHGVTDEVVAYLSTGVGGEEYIAKNVVLPSGIVVDTMLCIDNNNLLKICVHSKSKKIPIENLQLPKSALVICILAFNQGCHSINSYRLRGTFKLINDIIEKQGYLSIPLNTTTFINLPSHEKTPYLMQEINYKCGEIGMKLSAV